MSRFGAVLPLTLFVAACGGDGLSDGGRVIDAGADANGADTSAPDARASERPADPPGEATYDYVVRILKFADFDDRRDVAGFNLDGRVSDSTDVEGCRQQDWIAPVVYGGYRGVDNQIPLVLEAVRDNDPDGVPNDFDRQLNDQVDTGAVTLLFRLSRVGSFDNDGLVNLALYVGRWDGASDPDKEDVLFEGESRRAHSGGQTFHVESESVIDDDLDQPRTVFRDAWIRNGHLYTEPASFSIRLAVRRSFVVELDDAMTEALVSERRLSNLVIGGWATKDEIFRTIASFDPDFEADYADIARFVLDQIADIDSDPGLSGCEGMSLAIVADAVDAVIVGP